MYIKLLFIFSLLLSTCADEMCYCNFFANVTNYKICPNALTLAGIEIDTGDFAIDLEKIDATITRIEACLNRLIVNEYAPSINAQCLSKYIRPLPIRRDCLKIKIVSPIKSKCSEWYFLKEKAPQELCNAKGLEEDKDCPCRWRWAIQDDNHLIIPMPHAEYFYLYDVIKIHTSCNNYWADKELTKCALEVAYGK